MSDGLSWHHCTIDRIERDDLGRATGIIHCICSGVCIVPPSSAAVRPGDPVSILATNNLPGAHIHRVIIGERVVTDWDYSGDYPVACDDLS